MPVIEKMKADKPRRVARKHPAADARPVTIAFFGREDRGLRFKEPVSFTPTFDAATGLLVVDEPSLGLCVSADSRAGLEKEIKGELSFLWDEYALADDAGLSKDAQALKRNLLSLLEFANG